MAADHRRDRARRRAQDQGGVRSAAALGATSDDLAEAGSRAKAAGEQVTGDPDKAIQEAEAVSDGTYGIPVVDPLLPGAARLRDPVEGRSGDGWPSTQYVTGMAGTLAPNLKVPAANIHVHDGLHRRRLRQQVRARTPGPRVGAQPLAEGGRQAGQDSSSIAPPSCRSPATVPSAFGKIKVGGKKDGTITAWQSRYLGHRRLRGRRQSADAVRVLPRSPTSGSTTPRSPSTPAARRPGARPTISRPATSPARAIDDFAAKAGLDPMEVFDKNAGYTPRAGDVSLPVGEGGGIEPTGRSCGIRAARRTGSVRRGLGIGVNAWGGAGPRLHRAHHHQPRWLGAAGDWARRISAPARAPS